MIEVRADHGEYKGTMNLNGGRRNTELGQRGLEGMHKRCSAAAGRSDLTY